MRRVGQVIGGVGIDHERDRAEPLAERLHRLDVPAGLDLDLDAAVARGQLDRDAFGEIVERILDADRDAGGDAGGDERGASAKHARERLPLLPREEVPRRHLDGRLGHVMAANTGQRPEDLAGVREGAPEHQRRDEVRDDVPRGARRFRAVVRVRVGNALAESAGAVVIYPDEHERAIDDAPEARLEETDQRKTQETQLDPLDSHRTMLSQSPVLARLRLRPYRGSASLGSIVYWLAALIPKT